MATAGLEVVEDLPSVDTVLVPVGGGSGAAGYCLTVGALTGARVVGVQARGADAAYRAFHDGGLEPRPTVETFAEGLATRTPFALTMAILREALADLLLVSDEELRAAIRDLLEYEGVLAEGAAAAGLAATRRLDDIADETVVIPITGRNLSMDKLRTVLVDDA